MLVKVYSMSMAHGLEIRSPFLDFELVTFAFSLPENSNQRRPQEKNSPGTFRPMLPDAFTQTEKRLRGPVAEMFALK